ncbi:putative phage abortive infection protein [Maridesulfovibrio sp.]|uniref:putative phage abortive infection protein n=1 Tax=Maridesulfovibrio sp. TaxID=2795000 RepID=UPI0029C9E080|nr:putative phage abortive infection protein [Maridesulfovibrio sp.]
MNIKSAAWITVWIGTGCAIGVLLSPFFGDLDTLSKVGELTGGIVGPIWSLAAVLFFIAALKVQEKQLIAQKKDLRLQQKELAETREVFEKQKFENTFFNLLERHHSVVSNLAIRKKLHKESYKGTSAVNRFFDCFKDELIYQGRNPHIKDSNNIVCINNDYFPPDETKVVGDFELTTKYFNDAVQTSVLLHRFITFRATQFQVYLKGIIEILKTIDSYKYSPNARINQKAKAEFTSIVNANLSQNDMTIIYYYSAVYTNLGDLIKKHNILNGIQNNFLIHATHDKLNDTIEFKNNYVKKL